MLIQTLSKYNAMRHDNQLSPTNPAIQRRKASGFSLIELLIAMTLLLVLTALAVPNYLAALSRANEASAASSVRAIISAQNLYRNTFGTFTDLPNLGAEYLTDNLLGAGQKSGYMFDAIPGSGTAAGLDFTIQATPQLSIGPSATGARHYYGDQSAVVRVNLAGVADSSSPPL